MAWPSAGPRSGTGGAARTARPAGEKLLLEARAIADQVGTELPAGLTVPERDSLRALLHRFVADDPAVPRSAEPDGPAAGR